MHPTPHSSAAEPAVGPHAAWPTGAFLKDQLSSKYHGGGEVLRGGERRCGMGGRGRTRTGAGNRCAMCKKAGNQIGKDVRAWKNDSL